MSQMCRSAARATAGQRFRGSAVLGTAVIDRLHGLPGIVLDISKSRAQNRMCSVKPCFYAVRGLMSGQRTQGWRGFVATGCAVGSSQSGACFGPGQGSHGVTPGGMHYEKKHHVARLWCVLVLSAWRWCRGCG